MMSGSSRRKVGNMNGTLYVKRFENTASVEVSEDVILPDYLPEVRRIVGVQASVTTDGKYLSGEELEADGSVICTVIYTSSDGSLAQISESMAYTGHIPAKSDDDRFGSGDIVLSACADNVTCRVTAPRKITLSAKVKLCELSEKPADGSLHVSDAAGDVSVRRRVSTVRTGYMNSIAQSGECDGEIREREGMKPVFASGNISAADVRIIRKGNASFAAVKGEVTVNLLLLSPEGSYVQSRSRAPLRKKSPAETLRKTKPSILRRSAVSSSSKWTAEETVSSAGKPNTMLTAYWYTDGMRKSPPMPISPKEPIR